MILRQLSLQNFRNVKEASLQFDPRFNVLIGTNGSGKSTWLLAAKVACGAFFLGIPEVKSRHIHKDEIRRVIRSRMEMIRTPVTISVEGRMSRIRKNSEEEESKLYAEDLSWKRRIPEGSEKTSRSVADIGNIRKVGAEKYAEMQKGNDALDLPLIAFFGTSRLHGTARDRRKNKRFKARKLFQDGYENWTDLMTSNYRYKDWLKTYRVRLKNGGDYEGQEELFYETLKTAIPYLKNISYYDGELFLDIQLENYNSGLLPLRLHSDGIKCFAEMIAEMTWRCLYMNGYKGENAVKETYGVVMIDELDQHLHPTWQRHVVHDLKRAFPNIQFITTTHSPYITQSLEAGELINLRKYTDIRPKSYDLEVISREVMGVSSDFALENEEQEKQAADYLQLMDSNASEEELREKLEEVHDPGVRAFLKLTKLSRKDT